MSFLAPLFLLGAAGVLAPLWLHLRRRARTNVRAFSAVRFLDDEPSPREMPRQVRNPWLLLLRAGAVLLLALAFAGPRFFAAGSGAESETRVYLLDNTLSHRVNGGFERARGDIAREIRRAGPAVQVAVIEVAARVRVVAGLDDPREAAAAAVEALAPTHQRGNYLESFRLAESLLDRSLGARRKIVVYGDRQRNQWEENLNVPPFLRDVEVVLAEPPGKNLTGNLFVTNPRSLRKPDRERSIIDLRADLGAQPVNPAAIVRVRANGEEVMNREFALGGADLTTETQWETDARGWIRGEIEITGVPDVQPLDNVSHFVVPPLRPGKIGLLARSPYLRACLDPEISRGIWDVAALDAEQIRREAAADRPRFDALVVESDYLQSREARDLLWKHLNNGRGVLLFVTRRTPLVEGFLRTLGFRAGDEQTPPEGRRGIGSALLGHPALQPYARKDFGDLLAVHVEKYLRLEGGKAEGLLFAANGDPLLFETRGTKGRMLVFAFAPDAAATNWPLRPDFLPFLDVSLGFVRAASAEQVSVEPGDTWFGEIEGGAGATFAFVRDGREITRAPADAQGRLRLPAPDEPGIYELRRAGGGDIEGLVSVSASAKESRLDYIQETPAAIAAWTLPPEKKSAEPAAPPRLSAPDARWGWWALAGAAMLLALEMSWLGARRGIA